MPAAATESKTTAALVTCTKCSPTTETSDMTSTTKTRLALDNLCFQRCGYRDQYASVVSSPSFVTLAALLEAAVADPGVAAAAAAYLNHPEYLRSLVVFTSGTTIAHGAMIDLEWALKAAPGRFSATWSARLGQTDWDLIGLCFSDVVSIVLLAFSEPASERSVEPITTSGWYLLTDGRWGFFSWLGNLPTLTRVATRPPTIEEEETADVADLNRRIDAERDDENPDWREPWEGVWCHREGRPADGCDE